MHALLLSLLTTSPLQPLPEGSSALIVTVSNVRNPKGQLRCALFITADGFPGPSRLMRGQLNQPAAKGALTCTFEKLPAGAYAVSVLHDEDDDGELDTGLFGMPTEGYGVSNNHVPAMSSPTFKEALLTVADGERKAISVSLKY